MLFDLTSRGRKTAVKVIYGALAVLMGAGFILFGVGTGTGGGGIFDIFGDGSTSTSSQISQTEKRAQKLTVKDPQNAKAWADLTRARYQGAEYDNAQQAFTEEGREKLQTAANAWNRYLALDPPKPDPDVATLMATAYSEAGLNQPSSAASALEIVAEARPSAATYGNLAQYAYLAGEQRKAQLAEDKAIALAPKAQRATVRRNLANFRRDLLQQQVQEAVQQQGGVTTTPEPSSSGSSSGSAKKKK